VIPDGYVVNLTVHSWFMLTVAVSRVNILELQESEGIISICSVHLKYVFQLMLSVMSF
jgi:hypothetical protein